VHVFGSWSYVCSSATIINRSRRISIGIKTQRWFTWVHSWLFLYQRSMILLLNITARQLYIYIYRKKPAYAYSLACNTNAADECIAGFTDTRIRRLLIYYSKRFHSNGISSQDRNINICEYIGSKSFVHVYIARMNFFLWDLHYGSLVRW